MPFDVSIVWREGKDYTTDYYFCMTNLKGVNCNNKQYVQYPNVPSAIRPIPHGPGLPVPEPDAPMISTSDSESSNTTDAAKAEAYNPEDDQPVLSHKLNSTT